MKRAKIAIGILPILLSACGGSALHDGRKVVQHAASAGSAIDRAMAAHYIEQSGKAFFESTTYEEYAERMKPLNHASDALNGYRAALLAAESGLDVWEATGDDSEFQAVVGCLAAAASRLHTVIGIAGVDVPEDLKKVLLLAGKFGGVMCSESRK